MSRIETKLKRLIKLSKSGCETFLIPALAFIVFYWWSKEIDDFFKVRKASHRPMRRKPAYDTRFHHGPKLDKEYVHHISYVTDDITEFRISPKGCEPDPSGNSTKRKSGKEIKFDALFLISTSAENVYNRRMLRHLYSFYSNTQPYRIRPIFLVGLSTNMVTQANIEREDYQYRDIVQGNFLDHYYNLTYKTIMGYRWAHSNCKKVKLILKIDDDVYVDVFKFFDYFLPIIPNRIRTIYGFLNYHPKVFRKGKYKVAVEEYQESEYPNFCSGFFVVPTLDVIDEIYHVSKTVRFFRLEDVFTYGLVRVNMIDVQLIHLDIITYGWRTYKDCLDDYKYRCKYIAVESPPSELLGCFDETMEQRRQLGLPGGSVKNP